MATNIDTARQAGSLPGRPAWTRFFPVAPEGLALILISYGTVVLLAVLHVVLGSVLWMDALAFLFALFTTYFFRDPERPVPQDPALVVSAADGKVTSVVEDDEGLKVSVFLSVFDVHVNRAPVTGLVRETEYKSGEFVNAMKPYAEDVNERLRMRIETEHGPVDVIQVAGLIARRIICRAKIGDRVGKGERYGLIRFGSCTVVKLPPGAVPAVKVGDRVTGAVTPIARWITPGRGA